MQRSNKTLQHVPSVYDLPNKSICYCILKPIKKQRKFELIFYLFPADEKRTRWYSYLIFLPKIFKRTLESKNISSIELFALYEK